MDHNIFGSDPFFNLELNMSVIYLFQIWREATGDLLSPYSQMFVLQYAKSIIIIIFY